MKPTTKIRILPGPDGLYRFEGDPESVGYATFGAAIRAAHGTTRVLTDTGGGQSDGPDMVEPT